MQYQRMQRNAKFFLFFFCLPSDIKQLCLKSLSVYYLDNEYCIVLRQVQKFKKRFTKLYGLQVLH